MANDLIPVNSALIRAYRHYGVPERKTLRQRLADAVSQLGSGVARVASAIASVPRHIDRRVSRATGIELEWSSAVLTLGAAGSSLAYRSPLRAFAELHFHDRLGHLQCFDAVNKSIDSVRGVNHRLKGGHTLFWLPSLVRQHGLIAVPGYSLHVLQDLTTIAGLPLFPGARIAAIGLRRLGLSGTVATGLVTVNLAGVVGAVSAGLLAYEVGSIGYEVGRQIYVKRQFQTTQRRIA